MAKANSTSKKAEKSADNKISGAAKLCHTTSKIIKKLAATYRKRQYKEYKKCAKFKKKTGFWKFKKLKKLKKAKFVARKPKKVK